MPDRETMERIQQEVVSPNKDRLYQATLKEVKDNQPIDKIKLGREVQELKNKHHNWLLDEKNKGSGTITWKAMFDKIFNVDKKGGI